MMVSNNDRPVIYADELSIQFIESIVKKQVKLPTNEEELIKLIEFKISDPLVGGLMGIIYRVNLKWNIENDRLPNSIVIKSNKKSKESIESSATRKTHREVDFYKHQIESVNGFSVSYDFLPSVYYANKTEIGEYSIIMQDISDKSKNGYVSACKAMGNQCWGESKDLKLELYDQFEIVKNCFLETSKLHLDNWRSNKLFIESNSWLKNFEIYQGKSKDNWVKNEPENLKSIWENTTLPKIKLVNETDNSQLLHVDKVLLVVEKYFSHYLTWDQFQDRINTKKENTAFTLIHGDFHAGNIMIPVRNEENDDINCKEKLYFLDFSEIGLGCPFSDLSQFIISNCSIEFRRLNEEKLFKIYWDHIISSGKVDINHFQFDYCYRIYKRGGIEKWIMINILMSQFLPDFAFIFFFNQMSTFINDHYTNDLFN